MKEIITNSKITIKEALILLDKSAMQILIVTDNDKLQGVVTDGDIRRALLDDYELNTPIERIMTQSPTFVDKDCINHFEFEEGIDIVPVIDKDRKLVDIIQRTNAKSLKRENHIVIMAGGLGTRLGELTKETPKPMIEVGGKPILERVIEQIKLGGFSHFNLAVNYKSEVIKEYFKEGSNFGVDVNYLEETKRMGTAGALSLFKPKNELPIILTNADIITEINFSMLLAYHNLSGDSLTICSRKYTHQIPFGVLNSNDDNQLVSIAEKPTVDANVSTGVYVINPEVLELIEGDGYLDMPDLINMTLNKGLKVGLFDTRNYWIDVGQVHDLEKAREEILK